MTLALVLTAYALIGAATWWRLECDDRYAEERWRNRMAAYERATDECRERLRPRGMPRELADARIRQLVADYRRIQAPLCFGEQVCANDVETLSVRKVA